MGGERGFASRERRGKGVFRGQLPAIAIKQVGRGGFQGLCKPRNNGDRRVPDLTFDARNIGAVDLGPRGKFFLRNIQPFAGGLYVSG